MTDVLSTAPPAPAPDEGERSRRRMPVISRGDALEAVPTAVAVVLSVVGAQSARSVRLDQMSDYGLVSVLPPTYMAALIALSASFAVSLRRTARRPSVLGLNVVLLLVLLHGVAPLAEGAPRTQSTWKLAGVSEYIMSHGRVDTNIDAFFNWPGFFILVAAFTRLSGAANPIVFAAWAPLFFNALFATAVFALARTLSSNPRLPWLTVWLFCLGNWIGQDHLAPQSLNYYLFLVLLVILLRWFVAPPAGALPASSGPRLPRRVRAYIARPGIRPAPSRTWQRTALLGIVILVYAVMVPSHQLTPWVVLSLVSALVIAGRVTPRGLPVLMLALATCWLSYMAVRYLSGNFDKLITPLGSVNANVSANVTDRFAGSAAHVNIAYVRVAMSAVVWALALAGAIRRYRAGHGDFTLALIAVMPFLLLPLQTYGGELLMRTYFFTLPAMGFFAAWVFLRDRSGDMSWTAAAALMVVSVLLLAGWLVARYGDERMYYFTRDERAAVERLYHSAPAGAELVTLNVSVPWRYKRYDDYRYTSAERELVAVKTGSLLRYLRDRRGPTYLFVNRAQLATNEILSGWTSGMWSGMRRQLIDAGVIRQVYANRDAEIFVVASSRRSPEG